MIIKDWNSGPGKRAVVCSYHVPQPDRDSGSKRIYDFMRFLVEAGWEVTFYAADGIGDEQDAARLRKRGIPVYDSAQIDFADLLQACDFDLALLAFWINGEAYTPTIRRVSPRTRVVLDSIDVHFLRESRQVFQRSAASAVPGRLEDKHADRMAREINAYADSDVVLTVSDKETQLINDLTADPRLASTVPDGEELELSQIPFAQRKGILFVGSFQHQPNIDAVDFLCTEILPQMDQALLAAQPVYIVGNALDDRVRNFARHLPTVRMLGWVPSVEPYYASARISVVPLRYGAGTKRKLIQAMMIGTPTVSTAIGVEGLGLQDHEHALITDDAQRFALAAERLLTDESLWTSLAQAGREHVAASHHLECSRRLFWQSIDAALAKTPKLSRPLPAAPASPSPHSTPSPATPAAPATPEPNAPPSSATVDQQPRITRAVYLEMIRKVQEAVRAVVAPGAVVAVVSKGDPDLLRLGECRAWHFPQNERGEYAGHYPADSAAAVRQLEALRDQGAEYLVIPQTALWWLEFYQGFAKHLQNHYSRIACDNASCVIYALVQSSNGQASVPPAHRTAGPPLMNGDAGLRDLRGAGGPTRESEQANIRLAAPHAANQGDPRLIAFYLPQFHPIPENDLWWGEGFTEWRNVAKADPLFPGHDQPQIPADLGFYDLRCPETREQQAALASEYGIQGFCYYHYWFQGRRLLERPFNEVLASGAPRFPFCLCWANDPWSRRWDGRTLDLLQEQTYSLDDDLAHIRWLLPALADPRAIQVDGRPIFLVYRPKELPDSRRTTDLWRDEVHQAGMKGLYLVAVQTAWDFRWNGDNHSYEADDPTNGGFDAAVLFQPQFGQLMAAGKKIAAPGLENLQVYDYAEAWRLLADARPASYTRFDTVCPSWDNTARRKEEAVVLHRSTPAEYANWLSSAMEKIMRQSVDRRLIFINAWNEWAEGCHLEPDLRNGVAYLQATKDVLDAFVNEVDPGRRPLNHARERGG